MVGNVLQEKLGNEGLEKLRIGIKSAEDAIQVAELAQQAGIDVSAQLKRARENRDKLLKLKDTIYPGQ